MKRLFTILLAIVMTGSVTGISSQPALGSGSEQMYGINQLSAIDRLPYLNADSRAGEFSTYARDGGNNDGFYSRNFLYQDEHGDYVMCDLKGAGCINRIWFTGAANRSQNHIKVYLNNNTVPVIDTTFGEFFSGDGTLFSQPLTVNGEKSAGGEISYTPIPFANGIKITFTGISDADESAPGLFYQVDYEQFPSGTQVNDWDGSESVSDARNQWQNCGDDPKNTDENTIASGVVNLTADDVCTLYDGEGPREITSLKLRIPGIPGNEDTQFARDILNHLWVRMYWDNESTPSVDAPVGALFGIGDKGTQNPVKALLFGLDDTNTLYFYFPMPFQSHAKVELYQNGGSTLNDIQYELSHRPFTGSFNDVGYFNAVYQQTTAAKDDPFDVTILDVEGSGKFVGMQQNITGPGREPTYEEGDIRICVDDSRSPQLHGTGLEDSYNGAGYFVSYTVPEGDPKRNGWGYFTNPLAGFTAREDKNFNPSVSLYKIQLNDAVNFRKHILVSVEHGGGANSEGYYGPVSADYWILPFYYYQPQTRMSLSDTLYIGDSDSETSHSYQITGETWSGSKTETFEGQMDKVQITSSGRSHHDSSRFHMSLSSDNEGAVLRRMYDQSIASQNAKVYVDDIYVGEWYRPSENTFHAWREDDFALPASVTAGKNQIEIRLECSGSQDWSEFQYQIFSNIKQGISTDGIISGYTYQITGKVSGLSLDVVNGSAAAGARIQQYYGNNTAAQRWRLLKAPTGEYAIVNNVSGKVLDVVDGSNDNGAEIQQYYWNGNDYQLWIIEDRGNGYYSIRSKGSQKVLDIPNATDQPVRIQQYDYNGSDAQLFRLSKLNKEQDTYEIVSGNKYKLYNENFYLAMDVVNGSQDDGAEVQQYYPGDTAAQNWTVEDVGNGYYKLINEISGKALTVENSSDQNAARIIQSTFENTDGQLWKLDQICKGYFVLLPKCAESVKRVIDVPYATNEPVSLQLYDENATAAQLWRLERLP